jgi:hypothetical protein
VLWVKGRETGVTMGGVLITRDREEKRGYRE